MFNDPHIARMLDANANRAREALRVMEDYARFVANDQPLAAELKALRHGLAAAMSAVGGHDAILARDTGGDVGTANKTTSEFRRGALADVIVAAGKRLSEALRVLEECAKTTHPQVAGDIEKLRYRGYIAEQTLARIAGGGDLKARFAQVRLYILLTESLCKLPWEQTLDAILGVAGSAFCIPHSAFSPLAIQLREKSLPDAELLRRARILAGKCRDAGALAVINDRPDMALLAGAHGIHVGQTDLPCAEIRKLVGSSLIVGVSTENLAQARAALREGATYIGVGPMFPTTTKDKSHLATFPGPAYAAEALREIPLPIVPIGGISPANLPQLTMVGLRTVAVCAAIISQSDPAQATRRFLESLASPG